MALVWVVMAYPASGARAFLVGVYRSREAASAGADAAERDCGATWQADWQYVDDDGDHNIEFERRSSDGCRYLMERSAVMPPEGVA